MNRTDRIGAIAAGLVAATLIAGCADNPPTHYAGSHGHNANGIVVVREYTPVHHVRPQEWGQYAFVPGYATQGVVVSPSRTWTYGQGDGWAAAAAAKPHLSLSRMTGRTNPYAQAQTIPLHIPRPATVAHSGAAVTRLHVAWDRSDITGIGLGALEGEAHRLQRLFDSYPSARAAITGYTDSTGPADYNQQLSLQRAQTVRDYLVDQGVSATRLTAGGRGEINPIASNAMPDGRLKNRRVVIRVRNIPTEVSMAPRTNDNTTKEKQ